MRIVSLLPSLTELVCSLGLEDQLVGVTHECDFPTAVTRLPHLTRSRIPGAATGAEIDALVSQERGSLYELDETRLADLRPDIILTQEQCDVCAVNEMTVRRAAMSLPGQPMVESVNPRTLGEIHRMFRRIGDLLGVRPRAEAIIAAFESTAAEISRRTASGSRQSNSDAPTRVLLLEWIDPPFCAGHWIPELIALAGGIETIGRAGQASRRITWEEVTAARPEVILISPCGFSIERGHRELNHTLATKRVPDLRSLCGDRLFVVDGSAHFSRPGPRLELSLAIAAAAIWPGECLDLAPAAGTDWSEWRP